MTAIRRSSAGGRGSVTLVLTSKGISHRAALGSSLDDLLDALVLRLRTDIAGSKLCTQDLDGPSGFRGPKFFPRLHDLRHTYATIALSNGVPITVVNRRLGHATASVTLDIYSHCMPTDDRDAPARVAGSSWSLEARLTKK